jgi:hypothetical protein
MGTGSWSHWLYWQCGGHCVAVRGHVQTVLYLSRDRLSARQTDCQIAAVEKARLQSVSGPQQVLPGAKVAVESETLRDLVACDDFPFDGLVALVRSLAD